MRASTASTTATGDTSLERMRRARVSASKSIMAGACAWSAGRALSLPRQLYVLVGRGERPAGDEPEARLRHPRTLGVDEAELPDRRVHGLVVHELLDPVEGRLAALSVEL